MKKTLFLDLGNVIVTVKKQIVIENFAKLLKVPVNHITQQIDWDLEKTFETGKISTEKYIQEVNQKHYKLNFPELCDLWQSGFEKISTTIDLLPTLANTTKLFMLSNTNHIHFTAIENKFNLSQYFRDLVLSYKVGYRKPEVEIYRQALKIAGTTADQAYFVDDLPENIEAARTVGFTVNQYISHESFYNFLQNNSLI